MQKFQIDANTWATLNHLLDEALEQPASQLPQWLDGLAPQFDDLKPRLRELLSRTGQIETGEFLHTLPKFELEPGDLESAPARAEQPGQEIGLYRLIRELGSGGMGVVWLAERIDGLIERPVALKLPHGAWKRAGLAERLARERSILATLAHPNIAHLYDAGVTADGQPYLAIEYVEGRNIDVYSRDQQLDVKARLRLFAQVVNAVAYAHGKLVVHRDLKPANILVNSEGQVRLLDFGIAKLLEEGHAKETRFTELSGRALTPDYASPEQILGEPLTVASDVYSLGVVLYELLCDRRPYKLQRDSRGALEDAILQVDPQPPSNVVQGPRSKSLRGDLDTIVLKALKKAPAERYPTAHALLDDIERYLGARPVLAQPDSRWYRTRKFVARNKIAVIAAGAIFLAVLVGAGIATWQARVALAEKARAEKVQEFIAAVFREADPYQKGGKVLSAVELLRQAERRLNELPDTDQAMQLELLAIIGESLFGLQENAEAARVTEQALQLPAAALEQNTLLSARLHLTLSHAYEILGRTDDALSQAEQALTRLAEAGQTAIPIFARAKLQQSALCLVLANYEVAEQAAREAISVATATLGRESSEVATGLQRLSHLYTLTQRRDLSLEPARQSFEIQSALHARNLNHPAVIEAGQYYGHALQSVGQFDEASPIFRDATARAASVFGADSRVFGEMLSVSVPLQIEVGDLKAAIANSRRMIEIYLMEGEPGSITHLGRIRLLGNALLAARASTEAAEQLGDAVRFAVAAKSSLHETHARGSLGLALAHLGRFGQAEPELMQAIGEPGKISRGQHLAMRNLGTSLRLQARYAESLSWLERGMSVASIQPSHRGDFAHGLLEAGLATLELKDVDGAQGYFDRADTLFSDVQKLHMTPARADLNVGMARVHMHKAKYSEALPLLEKADAFWRDFDAENRWAGETALWLGHCYLALGRRADAHAALSRAEKLLAASPIPADGKLLKLARTRG